jgi:hypothetical protein
MYIEKLRFKDFVRDYLDGAVKATKEKFLEAILDQSGGMFLYQSVVKAFYYQMKNYDYDDDKETGEQFYLTRNLWRAWKEASEE